MQQVNQHLTELVRVGVEFERAFGIEPVTAGGGTVKVKNEVGVEFRIVARVK